MQTEDNFLGFGVDTLIQVFRDDGATLIFTHNDTSNFLQWIVHEVGTGFYFVRVTNVGERPAGAQTNYAMRVWREQGMFFPGVLTGIVTDADSGEPIDGASVSFPFYGAAASGPLGTDTNADGFYVIIPLIVGRYTVEAAAPGYQNETYETTIDFGETVTGNFAMTADGSVGKGEGEGPGCASSTSGPLSMGKFSGDIGLALLALVLLRAARRPSIRKSARPRTRLAVLLRGSREGGRTREPAGL